MIPKGMIREKWFDAKCEQDPDLVLKPLIEIGDDS